MQLLLIGILGGVGALLRYGLGVAFARWSFPLGTLIANVAGCLLIGLVLGGEWMPKEARAPVATGLLGGLTTFSSFGWETVRLFESGAWAAAIGNVGANLGLGLLGCALGIFAARAI